MNSIILYLHISAGTVAILSGFIAFIPQKGSRWHIGLGKVFATSMILMASVASYMALFHEWQPINMMVGFFTIYLVLTSQWTAGNRKGNLTKKDKIGGVLAILIFLGFTTLSIDAAISGKAVISGVYVEAFYVYTVLSLLALVLDFRVMINKGVFGAQRVARHLWRMVLALFIASGSLFLGQPQVFPSIVQGSGVLNFPVLLVVLLLFFWLVRVYFSKKYKKAYLQ